MADKGAPEAVNSTKPTDVSLEGDDTFEEFASEGMLSSHGFTRQLRLRSWHDIILVRRARPSAVTADGGVLTGTMHGPPSPTTLLPVVVSRGQRAQ